MTTRRDFPDLKVDERAVFQNLFATNAVITNLDAQTVSQRTIDFINSGGTLVDPKVNGTLDLSGSVIPSELIGPDFENLVNGINANTFDTLEESTFQSLNNFVGQNAREINIFVSRFYLEFQIFRKGVLARLADIPFSQSLSFRINPRVMTICSNIQPMLSYRTKVLWGTVDTSPFEDLTPAQIEGFEDLGSLNILDENVANRIRIASLLVPSSMRLVVKLGKYTGDSGGGNANWLALPVNATDQYVIDQGWLTDLTQVESILCSVDATASVAASPPQAEFDLPVYTSDSWIQTAFVVAATLIGVLAGAAGVPLPDVPADSWNGGSFEVDNLQLPVIELPSYIDVPTMVNQIYKTNASASPLIGDAISLGSTYNDDSWLGFSYVAVNRGSANIVEGVVAPEFVPPPLPGGINAFYALGQTTGYTSSIGLGDAGGTAYNYLWKTYYGVRFVDWIGSSIQNNIDPISTGGGPDLLYNYNGTFDKTGISPDGSFISDPAFNYVSVGGRPFIFYQDLPVPTINERTVEVTARPS